MSETQQPKKRRQLTIQMDNDLYESFKKVAKENDRTMAILIRDFAKNYVKKNR